MLKCFSYILHILPYPLRPSAIPQTTNSYYSNIAKIPAFMQWAKTNISWRPAEYGMTNTPINTL